MTKKTLFIFACFLACFMPVLAYGQVQVAPFLTSNPQFLDNIGSPCSGCLLSTFAAGTSTPLATYSDSAGTVLNQNPVLMDSAGRPQSGAIFLTRAAYKFVLKSALGVTIWSADNVTWNNLAQTLTSLTVNGTTQIIPSTAATSGANQSGPLTEMCGNFWNGTASAADCWDLQDVLGSGSNPTSSLTVTHSGSSGTALIKGTIPIDTATTGQFNNRIYVDGVKYPITQSGIQSALTDACAITGGAGPGTDVYLPPLNLTLTGTSGQQFLVTCNLHIHGAGDYSTVFTVGTGIGSTVKVFRFQPNNTAAQSDILVEGIGVNGNSVGGDVFFFDGTNTSMTGPNNWVLRKNRVTATAADPTSWAVNVSGHANVSQMGWNIYENNTFGLGIHMDSSLSVDSQLIIHNVFNATAGSNPCVDGSTESGSSHITLFNNNGGCAGGFFITHGTTECQILYNQIEQPATSTEANSAIIDIEGDTRTTDHCNIIGNNIGPDGFANIGIRLDHATNTAISGNVIGTTLNTGVGITLTANPTGTFIDPNTNEFVLSGTAVAISNSSGVNPFTYSFPKSDGTLPATIKNATDGGLLFCSNGGKCWTVVNSGSLFNCAGCTIGMNGLGSGTTSYSMQNNAGGIFTPLAMTSGSVVKLQVASDFTTASTSLATITGLTFTQLANTTNYSFHCELAYSQATAAAANAFGIQVATNAPTNVFATGKVWTSATAVTTGVLATLSTTTATNIVTFTPSATATNFVAELSGTIELPASANTVNFMALSGSASDSLTIKRGSYCQVW